MESFEDYCKRKRIEFKGSEIIAYVKQAMPNFEREDRLWPSSFTKYDLELMYDDLLKNKGE